MIPYHFLSSTKEEEEEDMGLDLDLESISEATSGAIGSLLSTTILYPLDTCKSKFQAEIRVRGQQKYRSLLLLSPFDCDAIDDDDLENCVFMSQFS